MAITAAMRQDIIELAVITNDAAPGTTLLAELVALADAGKTLTQITDHLVARSEFKATYPSHQTSTEFGTEWIGNVLPEASAALQAECVTIVEAHINGGGSIAALIVSVQDFMSKASTADAVLGTHISNFNNKVSVATYHTITKEATAEWSIPSSVTSSAATVVTGKAAVDTALAPAAAVVAPVATYALASDVSTVSEGGDVIYTLTTTNVTAGTEFAYVISGINSSDLSAGTLTGLAEIDSNGTATVSVGLKNDTTTEGAETMVMTVAGETASVSVTDSSTTAAAAAAAAAATFALTSDVSSADEGGDIIFTLATTNVTAGTQYSYVISGVESADISGSTTGTATIDSNGNANISVTTVADASTEGAQTLTMTVAGEAAAVTVNDTSLTAAASALTLDLTTAANNLLGAATDDYVDGSLDSTNQTLTSSDTVDGGAGTDTMYVEVSGTGTYTPTITNVETLQGNFSGAGTISGLRSSGVTTFTNLDSTAAVVFSNFDSAAGVTLTGSNSSQAVTLGFTAAAGVGTSDVIDIELSNVTGGTYTLSLIETVNVASNDTANSIVLAGSKITTVNATGAQNLTLGTLPSAVATLDASALTGTISATVGKTTGATVTGTAGKDTIGGAAGNDTLIGGDGNDSITGAAGNDSIDAGAGTDTIVMATNLNAYDVVDGGAGTDTLSVTAAVTSATQVTNIEKLTTTLTAAAQDMDYFTATTITQVTHTGTSAAITLQDVGSALTHWNITGAAPTTATLSEKAVDTNADSTPIINIGWFYNAVDISTSLVLSDYETITINSDDGYRVALGYSALTNEVNNIANASATTMTITGSRAFTITDSDSTVLATFDASAMTAAIQLVNNDSTTAGTYTTGTGNDSIEGSTKADTITTNAGNDSVTGGGGNDTISGGTGNDVLGGGSGKDSITGGDGNDVIDGVTGIDNLSGGAGNDTFNFETDGDLTGGTVLVRDVVDGGDGTDTVVVTTETALTPYLTSIEKVTATMTDAVALNLTNATSLTTLTVATLSTAGASITGLASGVTALIYDADFATLDTVAGASLTVKPLIDRTAAVVITDAASVTLTATTAMAAIAGTEDFHSITLDDTDTTSLTVTGAAVTSELTTGAISSTDALTTLTASTSTTLATVVVGAIADADSLTSITATGSYGALTFGAIGGTGTAEALSTITATANYNSVVTFGEITADTTNSSTENDITITATTDSYASSAINFNQTGTGITNTQGNITLNASGGGMVSAGDLTAVDVTITSSAGAAADTNTIDDIIASDDIVITTSGAGIHVISDISGSDDVTITHTGTGAFTVTGISDGVDDITIDASGATGAFSIGTNNDTGATSNMTATGGSGNDSLEGAAGKDTLTGGAGNDSLDGAGGNDVLSGGDGNDTITTGSGIDSVSGGAGNDTITLGANLVSTDTIDGGDGTDTLSFTVNSTTGTLSASQVTNVEKTQILFSTATGGAYAGGAGATTHTITAPSIINTEVILTNLVSGSTVNMSGTTKITTAYIDTAAGATLTVGLGSSQALATADGDITIVDAATVNFTSVTAAANYDEVALDNTDTTAVTITGGLYGTTVDDFSLTNAVTTLSITSTYAATSVGAWADADGLTSLTISGSTGDVVTDAIGATGDATGLTQLTISAAGGSDVTVGNISGDTAANAAIGVTALAVDVTLTGSTSASSIATVDAGGSAMTLTIANDGTIDTGSFVADEAYSSITATVSGSGSTTVTLLNAGSGDLTLTSSGTGAKIYSQLTSSDNATITHSGSGALTITESSITDDVTLDVSGATGALSVDIEDAGETATVTGSDDIGFTLLLLAATVGSDAVVTLGVNGVTDQLQMGGTSAGHISVTNFVAGASGDAIDISLAGVNGNSTSVLTILDDASVETTATVILHELAASTTLDLALITTNANILVLDGNFATSGMVETALETGGANALTANGAWGAADGFLVAWDDGTNSYLSMVEGAANGDNELWSAGELVATTLVTFVGISDVGTLTAANFGTTIIT